MMFFEVIICDLSEFFVGNQWDSSDRLWAWFIEKIEFTAMTAAKISNTWLLHRLIGLETFISIKRTKSKL